MSYSKKVLYVAMSGVMSGLFVLTLFAGRQRNETAEPPQVSAASRQAQQTAKAKQAISPPTSAARAAFQHKNPMIQGEPDRIAPPEEVLPSQDKVAIKAGIARMDDCPQCLERIAAFLDDPSQDVADKIALGRALMQSGTQADTLFLVNAILYAHLREESDLKDGLIQALADVQTPESTAALMRVITESTADLDFQQLPADLQDAIRKAIRLNPDSAMTGRMLATHYTSQGSPEIAQDLENVQHPGMVALLAKEAYESGDISRTEHLTDLLSTIDDPRTLDGLMLLAEHNVMPLDEATGRAYAWASELGDKFDHDHYAASLSDFDAHAVQRVVAAFVLAASPNTEETRAALAKAYDHENDPLVRSKLKSAMQLIWDHPK